MKIDYLFMNPNDELSTYYEEQVDCLNKKGNAKRYLRIEKIIDESISYKEITSKLEVKVLDSKRD